MPNPEVNIIGAGLGGRARTDEADGFLLDRGFQVLLIAYPEAQQVLDYDALELARFAPGALVRYRGKFHRFSDPWRSPRHLLSTALSPVGSLADKLRVARLRSRVCRKSLDALFERPESTTIEALRTAGFSPRIVKAFFRPFLGGVFLDPDLVTSSRMFEFIASFTHYLIKRRQLSRLLRNQPNAAMASLSVVTISTQLRSKERCCLADEPRSVRWGVYR